METHIIACGEYKVWVNFKRSARLRGYDFDLTAEEVSSLCHEPCHYCGSRDMNTTTFLAGTRIDGTRKVLIANFKYNGLDRVDNSGGYLIDNVVPCCFVCNRAKNSMSYDDFTQWLDNLTRFRHEIN